MKSCKLHGCCWGHGCCHAAEGMASINDAVGHAIDRAEHMEQLL